MNRPPTFYDACERLRYAWIELVSSTILPVLAIVCDKLTEWIFFWEVEPWHRRKGD